MREPEPRNRRGRKQSLFVLLHRNYRAPRANVRRTQRFWAWFYRRGFEANAVAIFIPEFRGHELIFRFREPRRFPTFSSDYFGIARKKFAISINNLII